MLNVKNTEILFCPLLYAKKKNLFLNIRNKFIDYLVINK